MATSTIFKSFSTPIEDKSLILIAKDIATGKYQKEVEEIRQLISKGNKEAANHKKKQLLAFTPSGTFYDKRILPNLLSYNKFIHLDFDNISITQLENAKKIISYIPYTFLCFTSPSGNGLKVFIETNAELNNHEITYKEVLAYYENKTGLKADPSCKDITRLCFMSFDPNLFKNLKNEIFSLKALSNKEQEALPFSSSHTITDNEGNLSELEYIFEHQIEFTNQKIQYVNGNRNNYLFQLASNCNRVGLPIKETLSLCIERFDLDKREIEHAINSAFKSHQHEFGKYKSLSQTTSLEGESQIDCLKEIPVIPADIYHKLPVILRKAALVFSEPRERDVLFTGALTNLSGCLHQVKGTYAGSEVFANLFSFSIAPAASGKGALKFAKMLVDEYHTNTLRQSKEAEALYNHALLEFKQRANHKKKGDTSIDEAPQKPKFKVVFIPANTSYAKILWHLEQNEGTGIMCETEADTLGNVFKQDWGSYSDMLRKAFHHERISSSRKSDNEFTEVDNPRLSISLSGTPGQVAGLISSSEDGLFSRFLYYMYKVEQSWNDVSPKSNPINLTEHFRNLSARVNEMIQFLMQGETIVSLTDQQWELLNNTCSQWLNETVAFVSEDASSLVKRLGLILFRICMVFTAMRKYENGDLSREVTCIDDDFDSALKLAETYLQHGLLMFNNLPKQNGGVNFKKVDSKQSFFNALPENFSRKQALEISKSFHYSPRTVDSMLNKALGKFLRKEGSGNYIKI
jgi:hypothetical protein